MTTGRKPNRLHVRTYIENVIELCETLAKDENVILPPVYRAFATEIKLYGRAILRRHSEKLTRKDIYIERR